MFALLASRFTLIFSFLLFSDTPAVKELKAIINSALSEQVQQVHESNNADP